MVRVYIWIWGNLHWLHRGATVRDSPLADLKGLDQIILFFWLTSKLLKWRRLPTGEKPDTVSDSGFFGRVKNKNRIFEISDCTCTTTAILCPQGRCQQTSPMGIAMCRYVHDCMFMTVSTLWTRKEFVKYSGRLSRNRSGCFCCVNA